MKAAARVVFGAIIALTATSPAFAGWRNVKWGMSKAAVEKLYPQATEDHSATTDDIILTINDVEYAGMHWRSVDFIIGSDGQLRAVDLNSNLDKYPYVKNQLASQFGAPVTETENDAHFRDRKRNNDVEVSYDSAFGLQVAYSRPASSF